MKLPCTTDEGSRQRILSFLLRPPGVVSATCQQLTRRHIFSLLPASLLNFESRAPSHIRSCCRYTVASTPLHGWLTTTKKANDIDSHQSRCVTSLLHVYLFPSHHRRSLQRLVRCSSFYHHFATRAVQFCRKFWQAYKYPHPNRLFRRIH